MARRTHLFAAVASETWGEVVIALRIAQELHERGETVRFVAPRAMQKLFDGRPFRYGWLDASAPTLHLALPEIARTERCDSVVLVDAALIYMHLECIGQCARFLERFDQPVIALDVWNLPRTNMVWDFGADTWIHTPHALDADRRLIPSPLASPTTATPGVFGALPSASSFPTAAGQRLRQELGLGAGDPLVLFPTATWQSADQQKHAYNATLARTFPGYLASLLARVDGAPRIAHLGPERFDALADALGPRYCWFPQVTPSRFAEFVAAADLLLSFNLSATSIGCAIAAGLPVLLGVNSASGSSVDELVAGLTSPSPQLRSWLAANLPLYPFSVWPFGYSAFLAPLLQANPYLDTMRIVEILDEPRFVASFDELLSSKTARADLRDRQADFAAAVARLPSGADVLLSYLAP